MLRIGNFGHNSDQYVATHVLSRGPKPWDEIFEITPSPNSSPASLSQLFCPHRNYYSRDSFSLSLHHRNTSTLLCMLLLDTTLKCKVISNGLITSKARVGFGRKLQIFKKYFFCIFEASGINFIHQYRGVTQYSCHMTYLNGFGGGGEGRRANSTTIRGVC